ncbi:MULTISPECIES: nucleotide pyrophosphohydrolase [Gulbenkiania]|uniref:NTP pyrophosphatase, house-cleaning of non-canonical NTPs n=2 Tax=Gulbenkiania TaxID=397456 RepID=A0A0K6GWQ8_9NEIS|nr:MULTISPECIES: nucleotide pyrophosphohydrolase [Gulbenkiania]TCW33051.1 NTP pyrophosphatase (non-canonical NTP hydrolase) [Gulbenkiania mobilis]CUA83162.1 NTP pyrophosphatase, house-cleaning of non-canonical NTPs [Gulbenkiania indica]
MNEVSRETPTRLVDVRALESALDDFARARDWPRFHTPRNLVLALTGEVGELAEVFQWLTDDQAAGLAKDPARRQACEEEIADVLMYLVRLASVLGIDLDRAVAAKLLRNAEKYPAP